MLYDPVLYTLLSHLAFPPLSRSCLPGRPPALLEVCAKEGAHGTCSRDLEEVEMCWPLAATRMTFQLLVAVGLAGTGLRGCVTISCRPLGHQL